jgi:hypothetical protein
MLSVCPKVSTNKHDVGPIALDMRSNILCHNDTATQYMPSVGGGNT